MGKCYSHLSVIERNILRRMLEQGVKKTVIARHLGVAPSTIYREIKRNSCTDVQLYKTVINYQPHMAERKYLKRRQRLSKLERDEELRAFVCSKLRGSWSPLQIEWHLKYHEPELGYVSHETIYRYIYGHWSSRKEFTQHLRRRHPSRIKQGSRKKRIMSQHHISLRPEAANNREEFGHWECDLMMFTNRTKTNLITLVERQSRHTMAIKNDDKRSKSTALAIIKALSRIRQHVLSITFDQGSEFADFAAIGSCLEADIYFCTPGCPEEKGGIENRNGVIRTVYPRDCDIDVVSQDEINAVIKSINSRPMLCLNYKSPQMVFDSQRELANEIGSK